MGGPESHAGLNDEGVGGVVSGGQCDCPVPFRLVMHLSRPVMRHRSGAPIPLYASL